MTRPASLDRTNFRNAYRQDEEACVSERLRQAAPVAALHDQAAHLAERLIEGAR